MARTLDQIYAELEKSGGYSSDRNLFNTQLANIPKQQESAISAADAKLSMANDNIIQGARSRGLGFSGIPLGEQAKYAATDYAPAIANIKAQGESNRLGILQSLNQLSRDQRGQAQSIYDTDRNFEEQQRQFNEQMAENRRQAAAAAAASSAASYSAGAGAYLGGGGSNTQTAGTAPSNIQQQAYNDVKTRIGNTGNKGLMSDYLATAQSAKNGNQGDLMKLQVYRQLRPDLFKTVYSWEKR